MAGKITIRESEILAQIKKCGLLKDSELMKLFKGAWTQGYPKNSETLTAIVKHVLENQYKHIKLPDVACVITASEKMGEVAADVKLEPGSKTWPVPFEFSSSSFESPADLVCTLGHEIVHQFQIKSRVVDRAYDAIHDWMYIDDVCRKLWELEAYTWVVEPDSYAWPFGRNKYFACLTSQEVQIATDGRDDAAKDVIKRIVYLTQTRPAALDRIPRLLECHKWAKDVWLRDNPNWRADCDKQASEGK